jgi:hypothetical protein
VRSSTSRRLRGNRQEYLICAALVEVDACEAARDVMRSLLLPGQVKVHWTAESEARRRRIVETITSLGPMNVVVSHLDEYRKKVERYRRKCLEVVYRELAGMGVTDAALEHRSHSQDAADRAHIVALQAQSLDHSLRISHPKGGEEPLLWIADAVLGAINSRHLGIPEHYDALVGTLAFEEMTPDSQGLD